MCEPRSAEAVLQQALTMLFASLCRAGSLITKTPGSFSGSMLGCPSLTQLHPSPTPCGDQRSRQGRGLGEDAKGRSLGQGRPYAESGSQRSSRALRPPADSPDLPVFPGSAWTPLTYSLCQGMGNRRVNGSNTPGQREKSVCARSASAAHPPSFLPPPPIRAPFSSARREGGGGLREPLPLGRGQGLLPSLALQGGGLQAPV